MDVRETIDEALGPVAPYVPGELISADALADISTLARQLPGGMTSFFGFECRLGQPERRADFLLRTCADGGERECLAGTGPHGGLPDHLLEHPAWSRTRDFAMDWGSPDSPLRGIDRLSLEFDLDASAPAIPLPSVFLSERPGTPLVDGRRADWWLGDAALPRLRGTPLPVTVLRQIARCVDAVPRGARLFAVGMMLSRPSDAVRLCVSHLGNPGILAFLDRIGWPGAIADVADLLTRWQDLVDWVSVHVDVGETVGPRIGLEYHGRVKPARTTPWPRFVDALVRDGLCRTDKRDGLLAYTGVTDELRDRDRWPKRLLRASRLLGPDWFSVNHRTMQYIKIGCEPGKPPEAKAYLGAMYSWYNRAAKSGYSQSSTDGSPPGSASRSSS